ncbi:hypothetical protein L596_000299 [Steinernema carpocapsae]|uniref:Uncharacterized protein n=1 Tax=Steinernema carpocapsae TaxID=34508 RepID=A0A4U8UJ51_STECR|nr:hypothetical protein L596_000299 [Steinernema carpocapsae]
MLQLTRSIAFVRTFPRSETVTLTINGLSKISHLDLSTTFNIESISDVHFQTHFSCLRNVVLFGRPLRSDIRLEIRA